MQKETTYDTRIRSRAIGKPMPQKQRNKITATAALLGMFLVGVTTPGTASAVSVDDRLSGSDRYGTAVAVSKSGFPETAPIVYLASGVTFADALIAAPAAVKEGASLLLTDASNLPPVVSDEINRLKPSEIVIVGGIGSVSLEAENSAKALVGKVTRIGGTDRYDTSRKVAARAFPGSSAGAYLVTGANFPDALSAGAAAGKNLSPVILIDPANAGLDQATTALLTGLAPSKVTIIGGEKSVSAATFTAAKSLIPDTIRINGADRYETSKLVSGTFGKLTHIYIAGGRDFPDALAGSAIAGKKGHPIVIAPPSCDTEAFNLFYGPVWSVPADEVTIVGGGLSITNTQATGSTCKFHFQE